MMFATVKDEATGYLYTTEPPYRLNILPNERLRVVAQRICGPESRTCIRTSDDRVFHLEQGEDEYLTLEGQP